MGKKHLSSRLSASQEEVLYLWSLVTLCRSKAGTVRVIQKASDEVAIIPQRLRNQCKSAKKDAAARQKIRKKKEKMVNRLQAERTKCNYNLRAWALSPYTGTDLLYREDVTCKTSLPVVEEAVDCNQCQKHFFGICSLHYKLVINREVVRDGSVEERARLTAPWPLYVAKSKIPGAGEGVWTSAKLPRGLVFGPYEGKILKVNQNSKVADSGYAWHLQLNSHKKRRVYVDSVDKSISNWLRYVNCARNTAEMNLEAFQYEREVYYSTLREIDGNSELLVWYGDEYGRELGILTLSSTMISSPHAQGGLSSLTELPSCPEEPTESFHPKTDERTGAKVSTRTSVQSDGGRLSSKANVQLSKPQSSLQHLFLPARLEPEKDHNVRVVYVSPGNNKRLIKEKSSEVSVDKTPYLPSVRFNQKFNCKYNHAYCVNCKKTYAGLCPKHPMTLILDNPVVRDGSVENRAQLTAPWPLYIAKSKIEEAGEGVWTGATLPRGLVFGPCEGRVMRKTGRMSGYSWEVRGRPDIEIDAEETSSSNWVRYINCARNYVERNLIAMQIQNEIFYVTNMDIERDTELMVWYGAAYGNWLGISMKDFFKPQLKAAELKRWCGECQVLFTSPEFLTRHQERCRQNKRRRKSKKRTLEGSESLPQKRFLTEWESQNQDKENFKHKDSEENLSEAGNVLSKDVELECKQGRTETVDSTSYSDKTRATRLSTEQSPSVHKNPSHKNVNPQSKLHKSQCSKTLTSTHVPECTKSLVRDSLLESPLENEPRHSLYKVPSDCVGNPGCREGKRQQTSVSVDCSLPDIATNSSQAPNTSTPILQNPLRHYRKISCLETSEIRHQVMVDSDSNFLSDFVNHDLPFIDSMDLDNCTLSTTSNTTTDFDDSRLSERYLHDRGRDHCSGYSSISSLSLSSSGDLTQSCGVSYLSRGLAHSYDMVQASTSTERSNSAEETQTPEHIHSKMKGTQTPEPIHSKIKETQAPEHIHNKKNDMSSVVSRVGFPGPHKTSRSSQSRHWERKCSCPYARKVGKPRCDVSQVSGKNCHPITDAVPRGTLKRKDFSNTSVHLHLKNRKVIDYRWQWTSHATVQQHGRYHSGGRGCAQSGGLVDVVQTLSHSQKPVVPHFKECEQNGFVDIPSRLGDNETTVGISINQFYGQTESNQVSGRLVDEVHIPFHPQRPAIPHIKHCEQSGIVDVPSELGENETTVGISIKQFCGHIESNQVSHEAQTQSGGMVDGVKTLPHPQNPTIPHIKECEQRRAMDIPPRVGGNETTTGISINQFYGQTETNQASHETMVLMNHRRPRQEEEESHQQVNPRPHQTKDIIHGGTYKIHVKDPSLITGLRHCGKRKEGGCARPRPLQPLNNKNKHLHTHLCSRNGNGTLYECFKCRRKFASKYNLLEHQQLCV
ncbi:uncharacterized protein LOC126980244 isoform X2 [Eriocheir sinensis]|uniref:uncharacterized protein LOC126980244 isoform X2 n=1 Tax=Eriocheir sinensis TaxID=95602 RepID=UPI0021C77E94|nr:uncharacterized protein LOC126980244 isoform X2 [Eriocheir sinensis]